MPNGQCAGDVIAQMRRWKPRYHLCRCCLTTATSHTIAPGATLTTATAQVISISISQAAEGFSRFLSVGAQVGIGGRRDWSCGRRFLLPLEVQEAVTLALLPGEYSISKAAALQDADRILLSFMCNPRLMNWMHDVRKVSWRVGCGLPT